MKTTSGTMSVTCAICLFSPGFMSYKWSASGVETVRPFCCDFLLPDKYFYQGNGHVFGNMWRRASRILIFFQKQLQDLTRTLVSDIVCNNVCHCDKIQIVMLHTELEHGRLWKSKYRSVSICGYLINVIYIKRRVDLITDTRRRLMSNNPEWQVDETTGILFFVEVARQFPVHLDNI